MVSRIAIDAAPDGDDMFGARDHTAIQVFAHTARPLLAAAQGRTWSPDGTAVRLELGELAFTDGSRVSAADYARRLREIRADRRAPLRVYLRDLDDAAVEDRGRALTIRLERPNHLLPHVLALPWLTPRHPSDPAQTAGDYRLASRSAATVRLAANPACPVHLPREVAFEVVRDPAEGIRRYRAGTLDATCDTAFPYDAVAEHRDRSDFHAPPSRLVAALRVHRCEHPLLATAERRAELVASIDRAAIAARLGDVPAPIASLATARPAAPPRAPRPAPAAPPLRLAVNDFYPNGVVAGSVAAQLRSCGVAVDVVDEPYPQRATDADLRLELFVAPFDDPFAFLLPELYSRTFARDRERWRTYLRIVRAYQEEADPARRAAVAEAADRVLASSAHVVPLLRLPRFYLARGAAATLLARGTS